MKRNRGLNSIDRRAGEFLTQYLHMLTRKEKLSRGIFECVRHENWGWVNTREFDFSLIEVAREKKFCFRFVMRKCSVE